MRHITRKNIQLIIMTLLGFVCFTALRSSGMKTDPFFQIGTLRIPSSTKSGILSGTLSLIYILLIFTNYKKGFIIGVVMNIISTTYLLFTMIHTHSIVSMPGMVTNFVSIVTLFTIYSFYSRLSVSNMTTILQIRVTAVVM